MKIVCPTCNTEYTVPDERIPLKRTPLMCKKCGGNITVEPQVAAQAEPLETPSGFSHPYRPPSPARETQESAKLALIAEYPELQGLDTQKFDLQAIFSPTKKGGYKGRKNNLKLKILKTVCDLLDKKILTEGESVMRIAKGTAFYPAELFFGNGFLTMIYNHYAIVSTNQRLLFLNINSRVTHPTHYFFQMPYKEIRNVKRGLFSGSLMLDPVKGKRRTFLYVKSYLSKELAQFITEKKGTVTRADHSEGFLENLCPSCFVPLKKGLVSCPDCQADFKVPKKAFFKSLLLPGFGDIYLGHRALGILELIGSLLVWLVAISFLLSGEEMSLTAAIFLLLFYNGIDGSLTYYMANKGYMLARPN